MCDEETQEIFADSKDDNLLLIMLLLFAGLQNNCDDELGDDDAGSQE